MALTVSLTSPIANAKPGIYSAGSTKYVRLIGDVAYPAGGYPATPSQLGFVQWIHAVNVLSQDTVAGSSYQTVYDPINKAVRFYLQPSGANTAMNEVATGSNLSSVTLDVQVLGW